MQIRNSVAHCGICVYTDPMIYDTIENIRQYAAASKRLEEGMRMLEELLAQDSPAWERHPGASGMYGTNRRYRTSRPEDRAYESHLRHIDIQYVVSGRELVYIRPYHASLPRAGDYDETGDVVFYDLDSSWSASCLLEPGMAVILFPQDIHKPCCHGPLGEQEVHKLCIKVPL